MGDGGLTFSQGLRHQQEGSNSYISCYRLHLWHKQVVFSLSSCGYLLLYYTMVYTLTERWWVWRGRGTVRRKGPAPGSRRPRVRWRQLASKRWQTVTAPKGGDGNYQKLHTAWTTRDCLMQISRIEEYFSLWVVLEIAFQTIQGSR